MMLRINSRKESKFPGLISLLKLLISIQERILIPEVIPFLESILFPLAGQIAIPRSIPIPESAPESTPETAPESTQESTPD